MTAIRLSLLLLVCGVLAGCASDKALIREMRPTMTGTVRCQTPLALPRNAVLTVRLLDVSRTDIPPAVLSERSTSNPGEAPIPFKLYYPYGGIPDEGRYVIEARIEVEGRLRYYSVESHLVTPQNAAQSHEVWVEVAGEP
ncbi:MAG: YbaY family lipoprotein [Opitutaceae bacterium]|nr:YbaY family lipoprotein [Opitutaceae bacterium]